MSGLIVVPVNKANKAVVVLLHSMKSRWMLRATTPDNFVARLINFWVFLVVLSKLSLLPTDFFLPFVSRSVVSISSSAEIRHLRYELSRPVRTSILADEFAIVSPRSTIILPFPTQKGPSKVVSPKTCPTTDGCQ